MKNIHVLPTNKPSRIIKSQDNDFILLNTNVPNWFEINLNTTKQNIYITSDEEIKEGVNQWYLDKFLNKPRNSSGSQYGENQNVIILTTDQDLIKDGVQAIDDEFLEWFVKNPSCEYVGFTPYLKDIMDPVTNEKHPSVSFRHFDETKMIFRYHYDLIVPRTTQQIIDEDYSGGLDMGQIIPKEEAEQEPNVWDELVKLAGSEEELIEILKLPHIAPLVREAMRSNCKNK
jgi:hypothetical protein